MLQSDSLGEEFPLENVLAPSQSSLEQLCRTACCCYLGDFLEEHCQHKQELVEPLVRIPSELLHYTAKRRFPVLPDSGHNCKQRATAMRRVALARDS